MGIWFKQILVEGVVAALLATGALLAPWFEVKLLCGLTLAWILFFIQRDPKSFYRRMFRLVLGAALVLPSLRFGLDLAGVANRPDFAGVVAASLAVGEAVPAWALFGIAALCVLADLVQFLFVARPAMLHQPVPLSPEAGSAALRLVNPDGIELTARLAVSNPLDEPLAVVGGQLRLRTSPPQWLSCELDASDPDQSNAPALPITAAAPALIAAKKLMTLRLAAELPPGLRRSWLLWRLRHANWLRRIRPVRLAAELELTASLAGWQTPVAITFLAST